MVNLDPVIVHGRLNNRRDRLLKTPKVGVMLKRVCLGANIRVDHQHRRWRGEEWRWKCADALQWIKLGVDCFQTVTRDVAEPGGHAKVGRVGMPSRVANLYKRSIERACHGHRFCQRGRGERRELGCLEMLEYCDLWIPVSGGEQYLMSLAQYRRTLCMC